MKPLPLTLAITSVAMTLSFIWLVDLAGPGRVALLAVAVAAHLVLVLTPRFRSGLTPITVLVLAALGIAGAVAATPRGTDLWAYQMYGRTVTEHQSNPYDHPPADFPDDPVLERMQGSWTGARTVYGPTHTSLAVVSAKVTGTNELAGRLFWQGLCGLSIFGGVLLLLRHTKDPVGMASLGLNPLVLYQLVHLAHNDAVLGVLILWAVLLARENRQVTAAIILVLAAMIKAPAGIALVAYLFWVLAKRGTKHALAAALASGFVGMVGLATFGGMKVLDPMLGSRLMSNGYTPWNLLRGGWRIFTGVSLPDLPFYASSRMATAATVTSLVVLVGLGFLNILRSERATFLTRRRRNDGHWRPESAGAPDPGPMILCLLLVWLFLSLYTSPWSFGWVIPLAGLYPSTNLSRGVLLYAGLFQVTAEWGILTVASFLLGNPSFSYQDNVHAVLKSLLLVFLVVFVGALLFDGAQRLGARRGGSPSEREG